MPEENFKTRYRAICEETGWEGDWFDTEEEATDQAIAYKRAQPENRDRIVRVIARQTPL